MCVLMALVGQTPDSFLGPRSFKPPDLEIIEVQHKRPAHIYTLQDFRRSATELPNLLHVYKLARHPYRHPKVDAGDLVFVGASEVPRHWSSPLETHLLEGSPLVPGPLFQPPPLKHLWLLGTSNTLVMRFHPCSCSFTRGYPLKPGGPGHRVVWK